MAINSMSSVSHGLSGLVSGMDTQSMVDSMLAGTQAKIDKQKANKTILNYRRDIYRNSITSLKSLQKNFLSFTGGSNNMLGSAFYNTMAVSSTSKYFKVSAGGSALTGKNTVNSIEQLAQSLKMKSLLSKTTSAVEGELDLSKIKTEDGGTEIQLMLDGVSKTIKLPQIEDNPSFVAGDKEKVFVEQLNAAITHTFGNGVKAELNGTKISFKAADTSREFKIIGNADAMATLGMKTGISNKINTSMRMQDINFAEPLAGDSFKFKINGVEITADASDSLDTVISKINNSNANVKVRYSSIEDKFSIESTVSGSGTSITMSQSEGNLLTAMFGVGSGSSVTGKTQYTYGDMSGKVPGVTDTMVADDIAKQIDTMNGNIDKYISELKGSFALNVDGKEIKIEIPEKGADDEYSIDDVIDAINANTELDAKGIKMSLSSADGKVTLTANDGVKVSAGSGMGLVGISGSNQKVATKDSTLAEMGFAGDATTGKLEIDINGTKLSFALDSKLSDVTTAMENELKAQATAAGLTTEQVGAIKVEVLEAPPGSEGKIRLFGVDIPTNIEISGDDKALFGTDEIKLSSGNKTDGTVDPDGSKMELVTTGQNAIAYINGERVERNGNEFTVGGLSFELKETFNEGYSAETVHDTTKYENIEVTRDTDKIYNGVVKFMEEYNKIVESTWTMLKAKTTYKDYPPLTDAQRESMSDKEVELWEKKSQEGLMRSDESLTAIMDAMRQVLTRKPAGSQYSLADMGLTVGYDMETGIGGKLEFNDSVSGGATPGDKLRKMIAQEPEALEKLFSDSDTGVMVELNKVLTGATSASGSKSNTYGRLSLVDVAGSPTMIDTSSRMYNEAKDIDTNLANLKRKYEAEYSRYWKQFNAMEQMVQQMNQQSSWLTQQLGG